ncbi:RICIN domain-containing protein [Caulobacter sp. 17J80-11]|uniref:RICIN domain-containing protein n=1 Tax=Caulobacter sp. 17J80-11 TaxID=2763502 RepID=UPI0016537C0E|nr:RICIN domain-containing protein [Caulobacter sp. 17J80-11]MBC6981415.1 RICIN domain-containing protein [Caulobacter sp. 17J80-11]
MIKGSGVLCALVVACASFLAADAGRAQEKPKPVAPAPVVAKPVRPVVPPAVQVSLQAPPVAEGLRPRWVPPKPKEIALKKTDVAGVFVVKFAEGSHVRLGPDGFYVDPSLTGLADGAERRLARTGLKYDGVAQELAAIKALLASSPDARAFKASYAFRPDKPRLPKGGGVDPQYAEKDELEQRSGEELADLDLYYVLAAPDFTDAAAQARLMNQLNRFRSVEQVYAAVVTDTPQAATGDLSSNQGHLGPAPVGIGAQLAWTRPGGRGDGVLVADVEYDWVTDHEDFPPASSLFAGGRPGCAYVAKESEHGTEVMGVIASPHNGLGMNGIAPNVRYVLSSVCRPFDYVWAAVVATFSGENWAGRAHNVVVANTMRIAGESLRPGDVLLIEQHGPGPSTGLTCPVMPGCGQFEWVAMEYYQESFDVIRRLTARGVIVVEAAGNGSSDLDTAPYRRRFDPSVRHSGALLIGSALHDDAGHFINPTSNFSRRIDLYSWGGGVATIGKGDGAGGTGPFAGSTAIPRRYTTNFGGTSSASAIVAGAVASLQGARLASGQPPLTPAQAREVLVASGTAVSDGSAIGVQPNLAGAIPIATAPSGSFSGPGNYVIRSRASGKVLDVDVSWFHGQDDGQRLIQWGFHGGANQVFSITANPDGSFSFRPTHTWSKCLDVAFASAADGAAVQQFACNPAAANQHFRIETIGGAHRIVAVHSGKALDVPGFSRDDGARIQQFTPNMGANQLFDFIRVR